MKVRAEAGAEGVFRLTLCGPRANALEPGILREFHAGLDALDASDADRAVIAGGRNFCSGGDVAAFFRAANPEAHADAVVPLLQDALRRMVEMPVIFAVAARGAITGGGAGLLFASDLAVLAPDAFVQPYYAQVGFAPDGGWTALLPERIGAGAAQDWLLSDARASAADLVQAGLAREVHEAPEERAAEMLAGMRIAPALAAKRLIWDGARMAALTARLEAETRAFRALIGRPETREGMARFLGEGARTDA
jgi:2-(1,2-epoxy-1,2-dihydrophenyl)acetyl-CoA isomerase